MESVNPLIETFRLGKILQLSVFTDENDQKNFERASHQWQSCLSTRVAQLILPKVVISSDDSFENVICNNGLFRQEIILKVRENSFPFDTLEAEAFDKASLKIKLVAKEVAQFFDSNISTTNDFFDLYVKELEWCGYNDIFVKCIDLYHKQDFFTLLLLGISSLERLLGDIIFSIHNDKFIIPSLIRDLLIASPLVPLLGEDIIFFLRCLIGPPNSMNLRNILWHGFINPNEFLPIPAKWYSALVIVITLTICQRVRLCGLIDSLKKRDGASFEGFFHLSKPNIIAENFIISDEIDKFFDQEYERVMFIQCSVQEHRLGTVEVGQYFLTLDIILEEKVAWAYYDLEKKTEDKEPNNQIYEEFGGGIMDLMLDLFIHNAGPRLRDRIAHGEANYLVTSTESNPLYEYYICLLVVLWSRYKSKLLNDVIDIDGSQFFINDEIIRDYETWISNYNSRFHPIPLLLKESTHLIVITWNCWKISRFIEQNGRFTLGDWSELNFEDQKDSLFQQDILKTIAKIENITDALHISREKLNTIKEKRFFNGKKFHWSHLSVTKEDLKAINLKRVVIKKAISGMEKLYDILRTLHSSTSLSSRKRKNTQNLFTLFPLIMQHLYYSLFILDYATEHKFMLGILIFVERWCGFCIEGKWKNINDAFDELIKLLR
ncbi:endoplasmic reticulum membrane-associated RNA degradation protein-like [Gigaspora margarita]|uniref:Endoplasmic reticulum membrane-associated RNA degradation protein-like n=1 Tax=Gigaspora margarita TaxID=4874 RepID=A0A8H3XFY3_GIGMA|nr:endoplasmic reticulum membrane-associated RNA degradation protein-like [Gigaspora margarita]